MKIIIELETKAEIERMLKAFKEELEKDCD